MRIYDLTNCPYSNRNGSYGGAAGDKDGILIDGEEWIAKYPKATIGMHKNDKLSPFAQTPLSEYLGSRIYQILGYPVHETILGIRNGHVVVACRDFCRGNARLLEMRTLKNIHISEMNREFGTDLHETSDDRLVDLNELFVHFRLNPEISKIHAVSERFWDQVIIDGLIGNNDRNNGNWGILAEGDERTMAPIFDNGASFYPKKSTVAIERILQLPEKDQARNNANMQEPYTLDGDHHLNYMQMLSLDENQIPAGQVILLKEAILRNTRLVERKIDEIRDLFQDIPGEYEGYTIITEARRSYYFKSFLTRFEDVLRKQCEQI